jgi:hypothetical protein
MPRRRDGEIIAAIILPVGDFASGWRDTVSCRGHSTKGRQPIISTTRSAYLVARPATRRCRGCTPAKIDFHGFVEASS